MMKKLPKKNQKILKFLFSYLKPLWRYVRKNFMEKNTKCQFNQHYMYIYCTYVHLL